MRWIGSLLGLAAALAAVHGGAASAEPPPPIGWQDPAPFGRMFLQLPFESPAPVAPGAVQLDLRVIYSNSMLWSRSERLQLRVQVETAEPVLVLRCGVTEAVELQAAVAVIADTGGFLDRPIEVVEGLFGVTSPDRKNLPRDVAWFQVTRPDGSGILRTGAEWGLAQGWLGVKGRLAKQRGIWPELALRAAAKVVSGPAPFGNGRIDLGGSVLAGWRAGAGAFRVQVDVLRPGGGLPELGLRGRTYGTATAGYTWEVGPSAALQLQISTHRSPIGGSGIGQIDGGTTYAVVGATFQLSPETALEIGAAENLWSPWRGADITFMAGVRANVLDFGRGGAPR